MTKHTHIFMISQKFSAGDGQGRVNLEIAQALCRAQARVTILGMRCAPSLQENPQIHFDKGNFEAWPTQLLRNFLFAQWSTRKLSQGASGAIVHGNGYVTNVPCDVNTVHFVHTAWLRSRYFPFRDWWKHPYKAYQYLYSRLNSYLERRVFEQSQVLIPVSEKVAQELRDLGISTDRIAVIHNGVDTQQFRPGASERERFGLPVGVFLLLFAGDIRTPRKNLDTVLRAIHALPNVHLAVAGKTDGSPFPQMAREMKLDGRVHFLGFISDMASLMRSVDTFAFPSRYDPLGLVITEAMASGLPVLTARTAGGSEIVGAGGRVLDDPEDHATLAAWIAELASDPNLCRRMGAAAHSIASCYSWDSMTAKYLDLYARVRKEQSTQ